jgi:NADH-quinone oxidoreductase subunit C
MPAPLEQLATALQTVLAEKLSKLERQRGEISIHIGAAHWLAAAQLLRDDAALRFEQLVDLCGMDYSAYADTGMSGARYGVVVHLLSVTHNRRLRVKIAAADDDLPVVPSIIGVWPCADWFEREAFDLFGIVFEGHPDLRRLLTDYGFIGHPFRKDFPLSGDVEMRYDPDQKRVIYQPVTIEPREIVPRIIRGEGYGDAG